MESFEKLLGVDFNQWWGFGVSESDTISSVEIGLLLLLGLLGRSFDMVVGFSKWGKIISLDELHFFNTVKILNFNLPFTIPLSIKSTYSIESLIYKTLLNTHRILRKIIILDIQNFSYGITLFESNLNELSSRRLLEIKTMINDHLFIWVWQMSTEVNALLKCSTFWWVDWFILWLVYCWSLRHLDLILQ